MIENIEYLDGQDTIVLQSQNTKWRMPHTTFLTEEFISVLSRSLGFDENTKEYLEGGVPVKILSEGKPWRSGKLKLSLEFIPDESSQPTSLLDDFRK